MAFVKLQGMAQAATIGKDKKKGEIPLLVGFVLGVRAIETKFGASNLYRMCDAKGSPLALWGNGSIDYQLLEDHKAERPKLKKELEAKLMQFRFIGMLKAKKGQNPGRDVEVSVDDDAKLPKGAGRIQFDEGKPAKKNRK